MPWTPQDLPYIVEKAHNAFDGMTPYMDWDFSDNLLAKFPGISNVQQLMSESLQPIIAVLDSPELHWLDSDVCDMLAETHDSIPEWTPASCMPATHGLVALEKPYTELKPLPGMSEQKAPIHAIGWQTDGENIRVFGFSADGKLMPGATPLEEIARVDLNIFENVSTSIKQATGGKTPLVGDVQKVVSILGGFWLLMAQPRMLDQDTSTVAKVRKKRGGTTRRTPVRVSVSSISTTKQVSASGKGAGQKATSRWWVRGHWRQQAWGKKHSLRKPIYILPHTAGAKDAEIDTSPKIQVWRE